MSVLARTSERDCRTRTTNENCTANESWTRTKYTYDSFGKLTASTGSLVNPFQYTARESDSETGLYYYRARYYDSSTGRFLSEDPIGLEGGNNFYRYAQNSPLNWIDPSGNGPICFSVTPNGITKMPCVDPTSCSYVPGGVSCSVPIPPGPPPAPNPDFANPYTCPCHPLNLLIESEKILLEKKEKDQGTRIRAGGNTAGLHVIAGILELLGAGAAAEFAPVVDLILIGKDGREIRAHGVEAQKKLDKLFAPCRR
jgi:RHS repeat-associated protein